METNSEAQAEALMKGDPGPLKAVVLERVAMLKKAESLGRYWVQVGAFLNNNNLKDLSARLVGAGFGVREEAVGTRGLRLLLAGPFGDREAAEAARKRIETTEKLTCRVKKRAEE